MATLPVEIEASEPSRSWRGGLSDAGLAIGGPVFDAFLIWGAPLLALLGVTLWLDGAATLPGPLAERSAGILAAFAAVLTYAHLIAVVPRAYLNRQVFTAHKVRLTTAPVLLLGALILSPTLFAIAAVLAVFWDIHHSAMQNFGLGRIYDMKAGNDATILRRTDLRLNWIFYVGPLVAGASLATHLDHLRGLEKVDLLTLARLPGVLEGNHSALAAFAIAAWLAVAGWAMLDYRRAMARGYRLPVHKIVLLLSTGLVSAIAWGFSSPLVTLISINIYHAVQYFALVWLKEGQRMTAFSRTTAIRAFALFALGCLAFGIAYDLAGASSIRWLAAPFIACSLLHFWFDGFVWSVGRKQV
jgi:hypothetical protein